MSHLCHCLLHSSMRVIKLQPRFKVCNISYLPVLFHSFINHKKIKGKDNYWYFLKIMKVLNNLTSDIFYPLSYCFNFVLDKNINYYTIFLPLLVLWQYIFIFCGQLDWTWLFKLVFLNLFSSAYYFYCSFHRF